MIYYILAVMTWRRKRPMMAEYLNKYYTQSHDDGCAYETAFNTRNIKVAGMFVEFWTRLKRRF